MLVGEPLIIMKEEVMNKKTLKAYAQVLAIFEFVAWINREQQLDEQYEMLLETTGVRHDVLLRASLRCAQMSSDALYYNDLPSYWESLG